MTPADDGLPVVGRSARELGVRVPQDVQLDARIVMDVRSPAMTVPIGEGFFAPPPRSVPLTRRFETLAVLGWECPA